MEWVEGLCFTLGVGSPSAGEYRKGRRTITEPVLRVDPNKRPKDRSELPPDVLQEVKDYLGIPKGSSLPLFVSKTQGWIVAVLLALLAAAVVFVSYSVIKQNYDDNQTKRELLELNQTLDLMVKHSLDLERKMVQLESQIENLKD